MRVLLRARACMRALMRALVRACVCVRVRGCTQQVQRVMSSMKMRVYTSQDIVGVQLGGALKNPLAVGAGMVAGMGFGINTLSAFVTRGAGELSALCSAMGGEEHTIAGLSGIGDLMLTGRCQNVHHIAPQFATLNVLVRGKTKTKHGLSAPVCTRGCADVDPLLLLTSFSAMSSQSRNQKCGQRLIKGDKIEDILRDMTVRASRSKEGNLLPTEILLEDTDGLRRPPQKGGQRNPSVASRCGSPLLLLTCALLMTSSHSEGGGGPNSICGSRVRKYSSLNFPPCLTCVRVTHRAHTPPHLLACAKLLEPARYAPALCQPSASFRGGASS